MIGPTGSGKTEISRRLADLIDAPLVKVEATKYTEVGIFGSNTDECIKDLVQRAVKLERKRIEDENEEKIEKEVETFILQRLPGGVAKKAEMQQRLRNGEFENQSVDISTLPRAAPQQSMQDLMQQGGVLNLNNMFPQGGKKVRNAYP